MTRSGLPGWIVLWSFAWPLSAGAQRVTVREEWSIQSVEPGRPIRIVTGMGTLLDGRIWISAPLDSAIIEVAANGSSARVRYRRGAGPDSIVLAPGPITRTAAGGIAIFDVGRFSVELFDPSGPYLRRVQLEKTVVNPKGFAVLPDGAFLLTGGIRGQALAIHRFKSDGRLDRSWQRVATLRPSMVALYTAGGPITIAPSGEILFSQAAPHRIVAFTPAGQLLRVIAADSALLPRVGDEFVMRDGATRRFRWHFPQSRGIFTLADGSILNVISKADEGLSIWEIYDPDGHLVGRTRVGRAYEPWSMTADGGILASYRRGPLGPSTAVKLRIAVGRALDPALSRHR